MQFIAFFMTGADFGVFDAPFAGKNNGIS